MALTPSGLLAKPLDLVRDLFAAVTAFQTWCGHAGDATATKSGHTHIDAVPAASVLHRPYLLVTNGPNSSGDSRKGGSGTRNHFVHEWDIAIRFCAAVLVAYGDDDSQAYLEFANAVGAVLAGMELVAGTGGKPNVISWRSVQPPIRSSSDDEAEGDFWMQEYLLTVAEGV